ncbi:MAG: lamin tail domain-containing protein [Chloroflexaceae bacterium]
MPPGTLLINEVLPAPRDAFTREWVELFNPGRDSVETSGWRLDDANDGGAQAVGTYVVAPGAYLLVELERAILNNSGDTVRLLSPTGEVIDAYRFGPTPADRSHGREPTTGVWRLEPYPSPGAPNPPSGEAQTASARTTAPAANASSANPTGPTRPGATGTATGEARHGDAGTPRTIPSPAETGAPDPRTAPTYTGMAGTRYHLPTTLPTPTRAAPAVTPPVEPAPASPQVHPGFAIGGLALIIVACALLVAERTPPPDQTDQDDML